MFLYPVSWVAICYDYDPLIIRLRESISVLVSCFWILRYHNHYDKLQLSAWVDWRTKLCGQYRVLFGNIRSGKCRTWVIQIAWKRCIRQRKKPRLKKKMRKWRKNLCSLIFALKMSWRVADIIQPAVRFVSSDYKEAKEGNTVTVLVPQFIKSIGNILTTKWVWNWKYA